MKGRSSVEDLNAYDAAVREAKAKGWTAFQVYRVGDCKYVTHPLPVTEELTRRGFGREKAVMRVLRRGSGEWVEERASSTLEDTRLDRDRVRLERKFGPANGEGEAA